MEEANLPKLKKLLPKPLLPDGIHHPVPVDLRCFSNSEDVLFPKVVTQPESICVTRWIPRRFWRSADTKLRSTVIAVHYGRPLPSEVSAAIADISFWWGPNWKRFGPSIEVCGALDSHQRD